LRKKETGLEAEKSILLFSDVNWKRVLYRLRVSSGRLERGANWSIVDSAIKGKDRDDPFGGLFFKMGLQGRFGKSPEFVPIGVTDLIGFLFKSLFGNLWGIWAIRINSKPR
jgi:hypothetical protein